MVGEKRGSYCRVRLYKN